MKRPDSMHNLVRLAVAVAVPTMACFGYYTLDALGEARSAWAIPAVLAYPLALIGAVGVVLALRAPQRHNGVLLLWSLCVAVPTALLIWLRA